MSMVRTMVKRVARLLPPSAKEMMFRGALKAMPDAQRDRVMLGAGMASVEATLRNMRALGFAPRRVVDVGAYVGEWTRMVKGIFPEARVLMVEAQQAKEPALRQVEAAFPGTVSLVRTLLGPEARDAVPFYEMETGSSVLAERSDVARVVQTLAMERLDDVVTRTGSGPVDFLKLDVQGFELEVLRGATRTLQEAEAVLMEVSLLEVNEGAPLLHQVIPFMSAAGFVAYDICSFMRRPGDRALWQSDFIFVRESSPLRRSRRFDAQ